ncbi:class III lanthionine synthetase LanKC [Amycolatopsis sp. NPDC059021]|uniref:class III lanthionine synthetase LanKC n=1 Tax=Amycolatopsis sp. NPDC059021 TaxID=3346704 RepID=UPI00366EB30A
MDVRYEAFCFADPLFFDEQRETGSSDDDFARLLPLPAGGWSERRHGVWRILHPDGLRLPSQGWKIHVSAGLDNAARVLARVHEYCLDRRISYKHLRSRMILLAQNAKYAPRSGSGKLITIYPDGDNQLKRVLDELSAELDGETGAYILSDLRYGAGPLYVRYGGFAEQWVEHGGKRVPAIRKPDGTLIPDERTPTFSVPDWVKIPPCLAESAADRAKGDPDQFPYRVTSSLHFSNGGGVYLANRKADGEQVVLKEARPYAGLDEVGADAVARLEREKAVLDRLAGIPGIPRVHEKFTAWEHHYLAMEYMPGVSLGKWLAANYPLTRCDPGEDDFATYTTRALGLLDQVERTIRAVHERGVVFGDLHALNILVSDDDTAALIDFELAADLATAKRTALGAPGFRAPADRTGAEIDEYALAAIKLWLFLPLVQLLALSPSKLRGYLDFIQRRFPLPDGYVDACYATLVRRREPESGTPVNAHTALDEPEPDWVLVRKQISEAILASATPDRTDRLFPGDIDQFRPGGGACFGVGAAGVLHALDVAGAGRYPEHEQWLIDAVRRDRPTRPGFFDGSYGVAYVLENLGHREVADELLRASAALVEQTADHGIERGLAGIGLTQLHFALERKDNEFGRQALQTAVRLSEALETADPPGKFARAGLLSGWSGPALLFIRLFERTGERAWLSFADQALRRDLEECELTFDGSLQVRDGTARTLPYAGIGSAGILMVAEQLARHEPEAAACENLPGLREACRGEFVIYPGLCYGRSGLIAALAYDPEPDQRIRNALDRHLARLAWHAIPFKGGLAFPGNQLLRLSMDVNTGGAGILLALSAVLDGTPVLPFLGRTPSLQTSGRA